MAIPFLFTLAPRIRNLYPIIQRGVREGLSATSINDAIRRVEGVGVRRQTLLDVMRQISGIERAGAQLRFLRLDRMPDINRLPQAVTRIRRRLSYVVRVKGFLLGTGEEIIKYITIATDTNLTRGEIEGAAQAIAEDEPSYTAFIPDSALLVSGVKAGEAGTL